MPKSKSTNRREPKDEDQRARREEARQRHKEKRREIERLARDGTAESHKKGSTTTTKTMPKNSGISASGFKKPSRSTIASGGNKKPRSRKRKSDESAGGETDAKKAKIVDEVQSKSPEVAVDVQEHQNEPKVEERLAIPPVENVEDADSPVISPLSTELDKNVEPQIIEQVSTPVPLTPLPRPDYAPHKLEFESSGLASALSKFRQWESSQRKAWRNYDQRNKEIHKQESTEDSKGNQKRPKHNILPLDGLKVVTLSEFFNPEAATLGKWDQFGLDVIKLGRFMKERKERFQILFDIRIGVSEEDEMIFPRQYSTYMKAVRDLIIDFPTRVAATVDLDQLNAKMADIEDDVAENKTDIKKYHDQKLVFQREVEMGLHPPGVTVDEWHLREPDWWNRVRRFDQKYGWCQHMIDVRKLVAEIENFNSRDAASQMQLARAAKEAEKEVVREKSRLKNAGRRRSSGKKPSTIRDSVHRDLAVKAPISENGDVPARAASSPLLSAPRDDNEEAILDEEGESDDELPEWMLELDREVEEQRAANS